MAGGWVALEKLKLRLSQPQTKSELELGLSLAKENMNCQMQDLSKYTVPTSFVGITVPTKVIGMLVVSAIPTKVGGMQSVYKSSQIHEYIEHWVQHPFC